MRPTVGLLADIQQSISFVTGPSSPMSQEADRSTQPDQTLYIYTLFFLPTAVQINVKETLRKFNLVIVLASKSAVQRGPLSLWPKSLPVFVRINGFPVGLVLNDLQQQIF